MTAGIIFEFLSKIIKFNVSVTHKWRPCGASSIRFIKFSKSFRKLRIVIHKDFDFLPVFHTHLKLSSSRQNDSNIKREMSVFKYLIAPRKLTKMDNFFEPFSHTNVSRFRERLDRFQWNFQGGFRLIFYPFSLF